MFYRITQAVGCGIVVSFAASSMLAADRPPSDLTGPWQLFVDDHLIAVSDGVVRTYHPFQKDSRNPLHGIYKYGGRGTVLPAGEGAGYRMWCRGGRGYNVSTDGITWHTPTKLTRDYEGSHGCCSVVFTPWDTGREYKLFSHFHEERSRKGPHSKGGGWYGSYSSDGIDWHAADNSPLFLDRSDVGKFCWDPHRKRYFGTPKIWTNVRGDLRRCVGFSSSRCFDCSWPTAELMLVPDLEDDGWATEPGQHTQFYGLSAFAYETMYIGFLEVFRVSDGINDGHINIELVTSRDGIHWDRMAGERTPILAVGAEGAWDAGMIKTPTHPLVEENVIKIFYGAGNHTHGFGRSYHATRELAHLRQGGTGMATLRKDGFASLDAGEVMGQITTIELQGTSGALYVNYVVGNGGWLKVELLNANGRTIDGYSREQCRPLTGDSVRERVSWKQQGLLPDGQRSLRIRFLLRNASLYSFNAGSRATAMVERSRLEILHTFEGSADANIEDRLVADGAQGLFLSGEIQVERSAKRAAFGSGSLVFRGNGVEPWDTVEISDSFRLGRSFTLAAMVRTDENDRARLLSSWEPFPDRVDEPPYQREGDFGSKELLFDFDPSGTGKNGCLRLVVHGRQVVAEGRFDDGRYHHLAATYHNGIVRLYLDGETIARGEVPRGEVTLLTNLRLGEDPGPMNNRASGKTTDEQLKGNVDDLLVLGRALRPHDVRKLARNGAAWLIDAGVAKD